MIALEKVYDDLTGIYIGCIWREELAPFEFEWRAEDREGVEWALPFVIRPAALLWLKQRWATHPLNENRIAA